MSRMLTFHDAAWVSARDAASHGRRTAALAALAPLLSGADDVPDRLVLLAHRLAGRVHAAAERYGKARRHLRAAAGLDPKNGEIHYEIGLAFENDPYGCDERAARRFRKALALDPKQLKYAAAGRALVRIDRVRAGVRHLLAAAAAAPGDATVLAVVVDGLLDAGRIAAARRVVVKAKFLAPHDRKVAALWQQVQFATARRDQERAQSDTAVRVAVPFLRLTGATRMMTTGGGVIRRDAGTRQGPHFGRLRAFRG